MSWHFAGSIVVIGLLVGTAGCAGTSGDDAATGGDSALSAASELSASDVDAAITTLDRRRSAAPIGPFYTDGNRLEGCWRNPAGDKLTDLQKAFYCSMPLEFRICNTVVLLTLDESEVDRRFSGYLDCQKKVDGVFGSKGQFVYDDSINAMYRSLFLERGALADADTTRIVAAAKPQFSTRSFTIVLAEIVASLADEAVRLSVDGLTALIDDYKHAAEADPR